MPNAEPFINFLATKTGILTPFHCYFCKMAAKSADLKPFKTVDDSEQCDLEQWNSAICMRNPKIRDILDFVQVKSRKNPDLPR